MIFKIILLSLIAFSCCNFCVENDMNGLTKIYNNMNGQNWIKNNNWMQNVSCCDWYGVSCVDSRVSSINFPPNNISGYFPNLNGTLNFLKQLSIIGNFIKGGLSELCFLNLSIINLDNNLIYEEIPFHILQNENIVYLNIANNNLYGSIPTINAPNIENLYLFNNQLSGQFPWILNSSLINIDVSNNYLDFLPDTFENTKQLQKIFLNKNNISSEIPNSLATIPIQEIVLDDNQFYGTIPYDFIFSRTLEGFYANDNLLSKGINHLKSVKFIEVVNNQFEEIINPNFLGYAKVFLARNNNFKGTVNIFCNMDSNVIDLTNNNNIKGELIYYDESWCKFDIFGDPKYESEYYECYNFMINECLMLVDGSFFDYKFCSIRFL